MEGKSADEELQTLDEDDTFYRQWARELVEKNRIGETAGNVRHALTLTIGSRSGLSERRAVAYRGCQPARYAHFGPRSSLLD